MNEPEYRLERIENPEILAELDKLIQDQIQQNLAHLRNDLMTISADKEAVVFGVADLALNQAVNLGLSGLAGQTELTLSDNNPLFAVIRNNGERLSSLDGLTHVAGSDNYRAMFHNSKGIAEHAQLKNVDPRGAVKIDPTDAATVAQGVQAAMAVASVVVGQYYMAQISHQLDGIANGINSLVNRVETRIQTDLLTYQEILMDLAADKQELQKAENVRNIKLRQIDSITESVLKIGNEAVERVSAIMNRPLKNTSAYVEAIHDLELEQRTAVIAASLLNIAADLTVLYSQGQITAAIAGKSANRFATKVQDQFDALHEYIENQNEAFHLADRKPEKREQFGKAVAESLPDKFGLKGTLATVIAGANEIVDYGFDLTMDDEKLQSITPVIEVIESRKPVQTQSMTIEADLNGNVQILVEDGIPYYVREKVQR
jgi:hypothetical protein